MLRFRRKSQGSIRMNDASVLDLEELLAPLQDGGAGEDPRSSAAFQDLQAAWTDARDLEQRRDMPFGEDDAEGAQSAAEASARIPDAWRRVRRLAEQILTRQAKDFEVALWLTEALLRLEGLAGLTDGIRLLDGMCERYWETGHPLPDEDGLDFRSSRIERLSGTGDEDDPRTGAGGSLLTPLRRLPLFTGADGEERALWQYTKRDGTLDLERLAEEARADPATLRAVGAEAQAAAEAWAALEARLSGLFPPDLAPATRRLGQVLGRIIAAARRGGGELPDTLAEAAPAAAPAPGEPSGPQRAAPGPGAVALDPAAAIATREDALQQLERLAAFFRRTEPQSPLSYTLSDAVRRARMPLPELLAEVMGNDESARVALLSALGIRPPVEGE